MPAHPLEAPEQIVVSRLFRRHDTAANCNGAGVVDQCFRLDKVRTDLAARRQVRQYQISATRSALRSIQVCQTHDRWGGAGCGDFDRAFRIAAAAGPAQSAVRSGSCSMRCRMGEFIKSRIIVFTSSFRGLLAGIQLIQLVLDAPYRGTGRLLTSGMTILFRDDE